MSAVGPSRSPVAAAPADVAHAPQVPRPGFGLRRRTMSQSSPRLAAVSTLLQRDRTRLPPSSHKIGPASDVIGREFRRRVDDPPFMMANMGRMLANRHLMLANMKSMLACAASMSANKNSMLPNTEFVLPNMKFVLPNMNSMFRNGKPTLPCELLMLGNINPMLSSRRPMSSSGTSMLGDAESPIGA